MFGLWAGYFILVYPPMTLKELCKQAHQTAKDKGFWQVSKGKLKPRNQSELLMLIVTELGEACEALRHNNRQWINLTELGEQKLKTAGWKKDTFEDELADVFIRLGDLCEAEGIDITWQIKKKMAYNKTRPNKHGKAF